MAASAHFRSVAASERTSSGHDSDRQLNMLIFVSVLVLRTHAAGTSCTVPRWSVMRVLTTRVSLLTITACVPLPNCHIRFPCALVRAILSKYQRVLPPFCTLGWTDLALVHSGMNPSCPRGKLCSAHFTVCSECANGPSVVASVLQSVSDMQGADVGHSGCDVGCCIASGIWLIACADTSRWARAPCCDSGGNVAGRGHHM
jgi:hypothetical protein